MQTKTHTRLVRNGNAGNSFLREKKAPLFSGVEERMNRPMQCGQDRILSETQKHLFANIEKYTPIINIIITKMRGKLPHNADLEELYSIGMVGLVNAIYKFDPSLGYIFETYASIRIRGSILDGLRNLDWMSRSSRKKKKQLMSLEADLEQKLGRQPTTKEVQLALGLNDIEYSKLKVETATRQLLHLDATPNDQENNLHDSIACTDEVFSDEVLAQEELVNIITKKIEELPYRQRKVIELSYYQGLKLNVVAEMLGVTEARISQIRSQAIQKLKKIIEKIA